MVFHEIEPVFDSASRLLILGSFPSVKSREQGFFYGHPQNRFWRLLAELLHEPVPESIEQKKVLLLSNGIALWDVIAECEIVGSSDSSIKNAVPNDLGRIIGTAKIERILCNGGTAYSLYEKYQRPSVNIAAVKMPSTSPANASFSVEKLISAWGREIKKR